MMTIIMLTDYPEISLDVRREHSPIVFGVIERKGFIDLWIKPWDSKVLSLPLDISILLDVSSYPDYRHPGRWNYRGLGNYCIAHGHVAFHNDKILDGSEKWYDWTSAYDEVNILINRIRSSGQA